MITTWKAILERIASASKLRKGTIMFSRDSPSGSGTSQEGAATQQAGPARIRAGWLHELAARWLSNSAMGTAVGHWASRTIALPQLRRLVGGDIPWTPLRKPVSDSTVVLVTTGGVHLRRDPPYDLNSDSSFRVIPKDAQPGDLAISHRAYDRTDALRDINLVFPIERLRELEGERVIGRVADEHYGFGLTGSAQQLLPSIKEVGQRISASKVDLALLVPA
jgi:D-proline reductase (dithiol) PrdB